MMDKFDTDRGQVGIGTLIVFIAMVLVAAIAAGVLVNTAGFLQATAEDAGQESVNKVTNRIDVVSAHGIVNETDPNNDDYANPGSRTVESINLTVRLAAGSGSVSLDDTSIKYVSDDTARNLVFNATKEGNNLGELGHTARYQTITQDDDTSNPVAASNPNNGLNQSEFTAYVLDDGKDSSFPVLSSQADRYELVINTSVVEGTSSGGLSTGDSVKLKITSRSGGSTQVIMTMPQQLAGKDENDPVPL
jgi:flagellin FlaB